MIHRLYSILSLKRKHVLKKFNLKAMETVRIHAEAFHAALHWVVCASHWATVTPAVLPAAELAKSAHLLCWMSQERPMAAVWLRKSSEPATWKPRPPTVTAGAT